MTLWDCFVAGLPFLGIFLGVIFIILAWAGGAVWVIEEYSIKLGIFILWAPIIAYLLAATISLGCNKLENCEPEEVAYVVED